MSVDPTDSVSSDEAWQDGYSAHHEEHCADVEQLRADLSEYEGVVEKYMDELADERNEVKRLQEVCDTAFECQHLLEVENERLRATLRDIRRGDKEIQVGPWYPPGASAYVAVRHGKARPPSPGGKRIE